MEHSSTAAGATEIIGWEWMDWKDELRLATVELRRGVRLPDGAVCETPRHELCGEERARLAAEDLLHEGRGRFAFGAADAMAALLVGMQARSSELLEAALKIGVPRESGGVAGTESLWLAIDQAPPNLPAVATLLRHRTNPDVRLQSGIGSLHFALYGGIDESRGGGFNPPLLRALSVHTLLRGRADPNVLGKPYRQWLRVPDGEGLPSPAADPGPEYVSALSAALELKNWYAVAVLVGHGVVPSKEDREVMGPSLLRALELK